MKDAALVHEAQNLTLRLNDAWNTSEHCSSYTNRLVRIAQRAYYRHLRRAARCGDVHAQRWLTLIDKATAHT